MSDINPRAVLEYLAQAMPAEARSHITIIGSLAAGWHFADLFANMQVRTKDIDCLLAPRGDASVIAEGITRRLLTAEWVHHEVKKRPPGNVNTPDNELPAVRLHPKDTRDWFIELLAEPPPMHGTSRQWLRVAIDDHHHYGLPSYSYLAVTNFRPVAGPAGIRIARPEMMALANALEHPRLTADTMSEEIGDRILRRCRKDLGRILALAYMEAF
jgi:hypothetical protein